MNRTLLLFPLLLAAACTSQPQADLALTNGRIWTGDDVLPWARSIAWKDGSISAVVEDGPAPAARRTIDLQGRFAMPGINDSHIHFLGGSLGFLQVDLNGAKTVEEVQERLKQFAQANPQADWIRGRGWEYYIFPGGRLPHKADLDAVVPDRPVLLTAYDGHTAWANSKALELAGVTARSKVEGFGELVRDPKTGEPTGTLKEGAMSLVSSKVPPVSRETQIAALRKGLEMAARLGITSIGNASGSEEDLEVFDELRKSGELTLRAAFALSAGRNLDAARIAAIAALKQQYQHPELRVVGVKFAIDGVIESHTAAMLEPYSNNRKTRGETTIPPNRFRDLVAEVDKAGLQVWTHAIGDRGVRVALDAYEHALNQNGPHDARFRIEHIETIHPDDIPRFERLGVLAAMQPIHSDPGTVKVWSQAVGNQRLPYSFPWASLEKAGATLVFGSDWPACYNNNPMRGLHIAVNRRTVEGEPAGGWLPEQRVTLETALKGFTRNGAYASFAERSQGKLMPGYYADLIVLSANPFEIKPMDLHTLTVEQTYFAGRQIYQKKR